MLVEKRWIVLIMLELIHGVVHYVDSIHECGSVILRRHIQLYISTCYSFFYCITSRFEFCGSQIYMKKSITFCEDAYRCMTFADVS